MFGRIRLLIRTLTHLLLWAFVAISVIYTTNLLVISPLSSVVSASIDSFLSQITRRQAPHKSGTGLESGSASRLDVDVDVDMSSLSATDTRAKIENLAGLDKNHLYDSLRDLRSSFFSPPFPSSDGLASLFTWSSSDFVLRHGLGQHLPTPIDEQVLLSQLFSGSMRPSNVIPYFYRAAGRFDKRDVTITTLITSNRLEVFARLVEKYRGPISVTLHIKDTPEHLASILHTLAALHSASAIMRRTVDLHLVVDAFDRQFNTWRNIARLFARTEFVLMLDIDFFPCTATATAAFDPAYDPVYDRTVDRLTSQLSLSLMHAARRERLPRDGVLADKLYAGQAALVVPAFEYTDFGEGMDAGTFPTSKEELLKLVEEDRIGMFHASWGPGHNASEYTRFYSTPPGELYKVTRYQSAYEPYVIFKKDGPPWCDERFVGYGGNKAACLFEMYLAGVSFYVHGDHFIIHQNHQYEESARKNERKINRKIYADFREEACLRYLQRFHDEGLLNSPLAENALSECRKIKSLARTAETAAKFFPK